MKKISTKSIPETKKADRFPTRILSLPIEKNPDKKYEKDCYFLLENSDKLYYSDGNGHDYVLLNSENDLITLEEIKIKKDEKKRYLDYLSDTDIDQRDSNTNDWVKKLRTINESRNKLFSLQNFGFFLLKDQDDIKLCIKTSNAGNFNIINSSFSLDWKDIKSEIIPLTENQAKEFINKNNVFSKNTKKEKTIILPSSKSCKENVEDTGETPSEKDNEYNNREHRERNIEEKDIIDSLLYWRDSKTVKFRYAENVLGMNIWRETDDIWGIARRVRNFFAEKKSDLFQDERYRFFWENDYKHFMNQYQKMIWIKNDLGKVISDRCSFSFDNSKSWIDQLSSDLQKKKVAEYINASIKSSVTCDKAIDNWGKKENIDLLINDINSIGITVDEEKTKNNRLSFFQKAKNRIKGWLGRK